MKSIFDEDTYDIREERAAYRVREFLFLLFWITVLTALVVVAGQFTGFDNWDIL